MTLNFFFFIQVSPSVAKLILVHFHWQVSQIVDRFVSSSVSHFVFYLLLVANLLMILSSKILSYLLFFKLFFNFFCPLNLSSLEHDANLKCLL